MLSSLLTACVTPCLCCAPLRMWLALPPRRVCAVGWGRVFPRLEQKLTADNNHLVVPGPGVGTCCRSAMAKDPGWHFGYSSLPPWGELPVLQPGTIP